MIHPDDAYTGFVVEKPLRAVDLPLHDITSSDFPQLMMFVAGHRLRFLTAGTMNTDHQQVAICAYHPLIARITDT